MKALMTADADVLCAYPDHNKPFHIFTDASDYQLGACIMQEDKPVAYYSKTLAGAWAGGTEYGVNFVLLNKIVCLVLCVTLFPFVIFSADL